MKYVNLSREYVAAALPVSKYSDSVFNKMYVNFGQLERCIHNDFQNLLWALENINWGISENYDGTGYMYRAATEYGFDFTENFRGIKIDGKQPTDEEIKAVKQELALKAMEFMSLKNETDEITFVYSEDKASIDNFKKRFEQTLQEYASNSKSIFFVYHMGETYEERAASFKTSFGAYLNQNPDKLE